MKQKKEKNKTAIKKFIDYYYNNIYTKFIFIFLGIGYIASLFMLFVNDKFSLINFLLSTGFYLFILLLIYFVYLAYKFDEKRGRDMKKVIAPVRSTKKDYVVTVFMLGSLFLAPQLFEKGYDLLGTFSAILAFVLLIYQLTSYILRKKRMLQ